MKAATRSKSVDTVAIVGSGVMGRGIAVACAAKGVKVRMVDVDKAALKRAVGVVADAVSTLSKFRVISEPRSVQRRISMHANFREGLESAQLVIESVPEDMELKKKVFVDLDKLADPTAILATNTSGLSVSKIASATGRREKVVGIHFFAPAYILKTVEIVRGRKTSDGTIEFSRRFAKQIGKVPIVVERDRRNFVVNSIQFAMIKEAQKLLRKGVVGSIAEVDKAIRDSFSVRQSVFGLFLDSDLISPYSSLTHPGREGFSTNYRYEKSPKELIRIRDESLLRLLRTLEELRKVELGKVEPLLSFAPNTRKPQETS